MVERLSRQFVVEGLFHQFASFAGVNSIGPQAYSQSEQDCNLD